MFLLVALVVMERPASIRSRAGYAESRPHMSKASFAGQQVHAETVAGIGHLRVSPQSEEPAGPPSRK
jgi:hypothetical protein